jgi:protein-L-isoaspartate(D-aspartate) O-methyltransferase
MHRAGRRNSWLEAVSICDCGFMRLRGAFRGPETVLSAGGVTVTFDADVDATAIPDLLAGPARVDELGLSITRDEIFGGLALWLALHDPGFCTVDGVWSKDADPPLPMAASFPSGAAMVGWSPASFDGATLSVLVQMDDRLAVHMFGSQPGTDRFSEAISRWDGSGRPSRQSLRLRVDPGSPPGEDKDGFVVIPKRWTTVVIDWPADGQ